MSSSPDIFNKNNEHKEDEKYFSEAFKTFDELRRSNLMTDIVLTANSYPETTLNADEDILLVSGINFKMKMSHRCKYYDASL